ncbi:class I SAM-dependent methyltransferase [Altericroceibacterium endophyticum]|uniref:Class I SAM-dependent methyltransferase n=1 Tax=Altericroceibacterium endophyticum TaxID=1808508 RepID=A0A6I4T4N0_9SPHN|nr:SAM-dependent methyltransferase [Altericroceibacterium endophyticum]MXO65857.1 class I SAM-dependent methyltransferase [Altericroceibacterium endophyticum]
MPDRDIAARLRRVIAHHGPITVAQFMGESNAHYYSTHNPFGRDGDFITAPEISQMFGELAGLWLTDMWARGGASRAAHYVELGPGRGTLARDALRAMNRFQCRPDIHLVEGSEALRAVQDQAVENVTAHQDLSTLPDDGPLLLIANEFLDALPIRQLVMTENGWRERMVALEGDAFVFIAGDRPMDAAVPVHRRDAKAGNIIETCPAAAAVVDEVARRLAKQGGVALFIDYGSAQERSGSTLQAVRAHGKVDALAMPGDADLTAHVDFSAMAEAARQGGAHCLGIADQGDWLRAMGIEQRAAMLAKAAPDKADEPRIAMERLCNADQMGTLFKVMALTGPGWPQDAAGFSA